MRRPLFIALALTVIALIATAPAAGAAGGRRPPKPTPTAPPPPGWTVPDGARFEPLDPATAHMTSAGDGDYRGSLEIVRQPANGALAIVNHVDFDDYLKGLSEIPVGWPFEAQKAQAIAARTYALWEMQARPASAPWRAVGADICATQACQVYAGLAKERREGAQNWTAAVEATRDQVIVFKGAPIAAKYSSSNGGHTVPGSYPYLRAIADPDDAQSPLHRWNVTLPLESIATALGLPAAPTAIWRDGDFVNFAHIDADGVTQTNFLPVVDVRDRINAGIPKAEGLPLTIPSVRFSVRADPEQGVAIVDGGGYGHGVGMSQFGALGKALRGMKAPDILATYYAGLKPSPVPASYLPATLKVAIGLDRQKVTVTSPGRFRIVDRNGQVVVPTAHGSWTIVSAPTGVVVRPPLDQATLALEVHHPQDAAVIGRAMPLTIKANLPAHVRISAGGQVVHELDLAAATATTVKLPPAAAAGPYDLAIDGDAGAGRVAHTDLHLTAAPAPPLTTPPRIEPAEAGAGPLRARMPLRVGAAGLLLSAAAASFLYALRLSPRRPVH